MRVHDVRIRGIDGLVGAFAARRVLECHGRHAIAAGAEIHGAAPAADILNRSVGVKRIRRVERDIVELGRGDGLREFPRLPAVLGLIEPAVVGVVEDPRIRGIDPELMVVAMRLVDGRERPARVVRHVQVDAERVDRVLVLRIDADLAEHPPVGSGVVDHEIVVLAGLAPRRAAVVGSVDLRRLDSPVRDRTSVRVMLVGLRRAGPLRSCR